MAASQLAKIVLSVSVLEHVERRPELVPAAPPSLAGWLAVNSLASGAARVGSWPAAIEQVMCQISARMKKNWKPGRPTHGLHRLSAIDSAAQSQRSAVVFTRFFAFAGW